MSRWNLAWLVGACAATLLGLSLTATAQREASRPGKHDNLKLLVEVLDDVQQKYVRELDQEKMRELVENMINGGLDKLDPHSAFINQDEFRQFQQQSEGKFGGVGIRLGLDRGGQFMVESPIPGTPAYDAGVMAGDLILKVDGKSIEQMSLRKVVDLIQGEPGTDITLTVLHENAKEPVDKTMKRAEIKIASVMGDKRLQDNLKEWDFWIDRDTKIAYVRINSFAQTTVEELTAVVEQLQAAGMRGLVVDLRNNPGGLLTAAVDTSSTFLKEGESVVTTKGRGGGIDQAFNASHKNPKIKSGGYPIAILINRYSASASEIVAAALQDHLRAVIIGERSYGKGSVQNLIYMENKTSALKLTTASYWRPSGRNIHRFPDSKEEEDWGVKPNKGYEVKLSAEERAEYYKYRRERDIVRRPGDNVKPPEKDEPPKANVPGEKKDAAKKAPFRDRVLDKATEYIRAELAKDGKRQDAQAPAPPVPAPAAVRPPAIRPAGVAASASETALVAAQTASPAAQGGRGRGLSLGLL
jgi:carboxyl-terminal processing protease